MRLPRPTKINQRVLGSAVVGLLAANAWAAAIIAGDGGSPVAAPVVAEAPGSAANGAPQALTLITTRDGRTLLVDPSTSAGRQALADAKKDGATTRNVPVAARSGGSTGRSITLPGGLDLNTILKQLPTGGAIEIPAGLVDELLKDPITTASSIVGSVQTTVSSVVDRGRTTVSSVVDGAGTTVSSVADSAGSTVSSVLNQVTTVPTAPTVPPATTPTTSPGGSIVTTVSTALQGLSAPPPTVAPSSPPPTVPVQGAVCGLLAHC